MGQPVRTVRFALGVAAVLVDPQRAVPEPLRVEEGTDEGEELLGRHVLHRLDLHEHPGWQFNGLGPVSGPIFGGRFSA